MAAYENGLVLDATLAESEAQSQELWRLREAIVEGQKHEGGSIKHDVSVPVSKMPDFMFCGQTANSMRPLPWRRISDR